MKACKNCHLLTNQNVCPRCSSTLSKKWRGYLIVLDHSGSEVAKKLNIDVNGKFALKVE